MAFNMFPYSNLHRLNTDWVLEQIRNAAQAVQDAKEEVDAAVAVMEGYDEHLSILDQGVASNAGQIQTVASNLSTLAGTVATQGDRINSINTGLTDLAGHAVQTYEQEFSDAEKAQARTNIGAVALSAYNTNNNRVNSILEYQGNQISALAPVTFTLNDSGTWPAQSIPEANRAAILLAKNTLVNKTTLVYATITQQTYQELPSGFIVAMACVGDNILSGTFEQAYYDAVNQEYETISATITVDTVHWTWDMSCKYGTDVSAADIVNATASMTASQQEQTRGNIGAASAAEQAQLITRVTNVEGIKVTKGVTTDTLTPEINHNYVYANALTSLTITNPPSTGAYSIVFTSGATATTTTIPATILGLETFTAEANTIYEINVLDNRAVVGKWAVAV